MCDGIIKQGRSTDIQLISILIDMEVQFTEVLREVRDEEEIGTVIDYLMSNNLNCWPNSSDLA